MRHSTKITTFLIAVLALTATSCYTQLYSTHPSSSGGYYSSSDNERVASGNKSLEQRSNENEVVNEEDYTLGYDDGWSDAEGYYFKDYEAQRWYEEYGVNLAHDPYVRQYTLNNYAYTRGYSPYYSYYYPYYPYYSHVNSFSFSLGFNVGWGWNHWYPHYGYNPYYAYYAYPGYYPYYGNYSGWGYGPYYGNTVVIYNGSRGTARNYGPRSNGLTSRGSAVTRRTRSDAHVRNTAPRSSVRSDARNRNVTNTRSRGTVNRSSGTTRSRSSSTVRSRSGSNSNSRGSVNRSGSSSRSRSSGGSANRSRSSSTSSSSSSRSRGNGNVSHSRSNSQSRTNIGNEGIIISRGNSIITNRENDHRRTVTNRTTDINTRNRTTSINNRINNYNNQQDRSRVESNHLQTRRERSLNSLRSQLLNQKASSPDQHYAPSRSRSNAFNSRAAREIYKSVIGNTSSRSRKSSSSYGRSSSSNNRSSSVSRSRSSSSKSSVRSSRSSSSSRSRSSSSGSSSRSRSSSSRDKN